MTQEMFQPRTDQEDSQRNPYMHVDDLEDADPGFAVIQAAEQTLVLCFKIKSLTQPLTMHICQCWHIPNPNLTFSLTLLRMESSNSIDLELLQFPIPALNPVSHNSHGIPY